MRSDNLFFCGFRASLDVEAQGGVIAVNALEFAKLFFVGIFLPSVSLQSDSILGPVTTDAKTLFDAARSVSVSQGVNAANKRTTMDVKIIC